MSNKTSIFKVIIAMIIWGSIGLFVKNIDLPSMEIAFLRAIIASFILILSMPLVKRSRKNNTLSVELPSKKDILLLILSGAAMGLNWVLLFQAYKFTTISNATLSYYFAPMFVILFSPLILKEKLTLKKILGAFGAMVGLFIILNNQSTSSAISYDHIKGVTFGLSAAFLYASVILLNKYIKGFSGYQRTVVQICISALVLLPLIISRNNIHIESSTTLILVLIVGVIHTGLAYLLYFSSIKDLKAHTAALLSYIDPISAIVFGTIFLKEPITIWHFVGGALILLSTFISDK